MKAELEHRYNEVVARNLKAEQKTLEARRVEVAGYVILYGPMVVTGFAKAGERLRPVPVEAEGLVKALVREIERREEGKRLPTDLTPEENRAAWDRARGCLLG